MENKINQVLFQLNSELVYNLQILNDERPKVVLG